MLNIYSDFGQKTEIWAIEDHAEDDIYTYSLSNRKFSIPKKAVFLSNITDWQMQSSLNLSPMTAEEVQNKIKTANFS